MPVSRTSSSHDGEVNGTHRSVLGLRKPLLPGTARAAHPEPYMPTPGPVRRPGRHARVSARSKRLFRRGGARTSPAPPPTGILVACLATFIVVLGVVARDCGSDSAGVQTRRRGWWCDGPDDTDLGGFVGSNGLATADGELTRGVTRPVGSGVFWRLRGRTLGRQSGAGRAHLGVFGSRTGAAGPARSRPG